MKKKKADSVGLVQNKFIGQEAGSARLESEPGPASSPAVTVAKGGPLAMPRSKGKAKGMGVSQTLKAVVSIRRVVP